ncbi:MAG: molybdopterin molybdenumtransferase MoeA [Limimaricola sp.]|uniref:molybdopterin molybdotransferase MoeA n=1 Tax=Limimaricola sp. TaxID=2211665 RepID=UPI001D886450|nr:gephyrin-like molybdotransferase Glp [Limimaricola sp.]MBI1416714.1 molybdopterin molybdenumtransferase MoeA [Limimaricola sp.]
MISVEEALARLFALVPAPQSETVPLAEAGGRVLLHPQAARLTQPPFDASAMDGYAVIAAEVRPGATLQVVGEAAAGRAFDGRVAAGQAVRIFTGAPVPPGATRIVLQEDVTREGDVITLGEVGGGPHIRPAGGDFAAGDLLQAPRRLGPADIALLAAMNIPAVPVARRPSVAIISTGNELVAPGETPGPDQIIASNALGLAAMVAREGALPRLLPIARDDAASLGVVLDLAAGADLVLTIGGASVGDHDIVAQVAQSRGIDLAFHKVAMRPGKPLMAGRMDGAMMVGLPGNPVSALVCGEVFVMPVLRAMQGLPAGPAARKPARLGGHLDANGGRTHFLRARTDGDTVTPFARQDSALLSVLSAANCLVMRPPHDPARAIGDLVEILPI